MLNITQFCWRLERKGDTKLYLHLHCAPGWARHLARALPREWGFRVKSGSAVRSVRPECVRAAMRAIEPDNAPLLELVDSYVLLAAGLKPGVQTTTEHLQGLRAVVWAVLHETQLGAGRPRK